MQTMQVLVDSHCIQTGSRLSGTVWRGLIFFTTDRPDYHRMVFAVRTGFALGHRASTCNACAHLITTAVRYQLRPKVAISSPNPTWSVGSSGEVPASVHTMGLPGKVPLSGTLSERRDKHKFDNRLVYFQIYGCFLFFSWDSQECQLVVILFGRKGMTWEANVFM